jgi:cell division protein FtsL
MARAAAAARTAAPAPRRAPRPVRPAVPRRKSGAVARPAAPRPAQRRPARAPSSRRAKVAARLGAIPHSPFVDRLLTGRAWIVLLAVLLAGIVFANVALLEMNAGIARTTEQVAQLKRENSRLRLRAAELGSSERIQRAAADLGLVLPAPGQVRYLEARPDEDPALALKRMSEPAPIPVVAPLPVAPEPVPVAETAPETTTTEPAVPTDPAATPPATTTPISGETAPTAAPGGTVTAPPATAGQTG